MSVETSTALPLAEIQPQTLRHTVRLRIEEAIVQGVFRGGEKLNEAQLCRSLGVSRGLVREALRELVRGFHRELRVGEFGRPREHSLSRHLRERMDSPQRRRAVHPALPA